MDVRIARVFRGVKIRLPSNPMKLRSPQLVLLLLFLILATGSLSETKAQTLVVCNQGSVDIWVTYMGTDTGWLFGSQWTLNGWTKVSPGGAFACRNPWSEVSGRYHIVYGIQGPNGGFGVVKYNFRNHPPLQSVKEICVTDKHMYHNWSSTANNYFPPCPEGFKAVPVSNSFYMEGPVTLTLELTPSVSDFYRAVVLREDVKPTLKTVNLGLLNGKAVSLPKPEYTKKARLRKAGGSVVVEVLVDVRGYVISAKALSGHQLLRAPSVKAALRAQFSPTLLSGQPVKVLGTITYNFVP